MTVSGSGHTFPRMSPTDADQLIMRSRRALAGLKTVGNVFRNPFEAASLVRDELIALGRIVDLHPQTGDVVAGLLTAWQSLHDELTLETR